MHVSNTFKNKLTTILTKKVNFLKGLDKYFAQRFFTVSPYIICTNIVDRASTGYVVIYRIYAHSPPKNVIKRRLFLSLGLSP